MLGLYLLLQGLYDYFLSPKTSIDTILIELLISQSENVLTALNYNLLEPNPIYVNHLGISGTSGVIIGNPCDGLSLFILYISFILIFKGKWWFKIIAIGIGVSLIHILNLIRIISLALIVKYYPNWLDFHHSYTFTLIIYACIFILWLLRVKIYQKKEW